MSDSLRSLIDCGTKLWLDSIDPDLVVENRSLGATGATSNPIIIADLIKTGRFDDRIQELVADGKGDDEIAWAMTDHLVRDAQGVFQDVWQKTHGNDGYVSFELDPLLEDPELNLEHERRVSQYISLAKEWSAGHDNRMIKVPATPAGLDALEEIVGDKDESECARKEGTKENGPHGEDVADFLRTVASIGEERRRLRWGTAATEAPRRRRQ